MRTVSSAGRIFGVRGVVYGCGWHWRFDRMQ